MYYIERNAQPEVFKNIGDGIWWAIITFATVGYGDIYPITFLGKLLGCIICLVGVAMVAIPTGIISSSFINIVQKKEKKQGEDCNNESDKQLNYCDTVVYVVKVCLWRQRTYFLFLAE